MTQVEVLHPYGNKDKFCILRTNLFLRNGYLDFSVRFSRMTSLKFYFSILCPHGRD